jgi:hypothetical protein
MSNSNFSGRTNIFGTTTSSVGSSPSPFSSNETDPAALLIEKIKWIAETYIDKLSNSIEWLGMAANQGQNDASGSFIGSTHTKPDDIDASSLTAWDIPALPDLPSFPALPEDLKVDMEKFRTAADELIAKLQDSWVSKFLPETTDISNYDSLFADILDGSNDAAMHQRLDTMFNTLDSALTTTMGDLKKDMETQIELLRDRIADRIDLLDPQIDAAITAANDDSEIAWTRARDQAAREGARLEAQAIAEWAARGFALPGGVLTAIQAEARQGALDAVTKVAIEEAIKAQERRIDLAKIAIDSYLRSAEYVTRADLEALKAPLEAYLKHAEMEVRGHEKRAEEAVRHLGMRLDFTKFGAEFALRYRTAAVEGMNGLLNAYANVSRNEADFYARIADAKRQAISALVEYHKVGIAHAEISLNIEKANVDKDLKYAETAASFIARSVANHVQAAMATGDIYGRVAQGALGGLNAVASSSTAQTDE